VLDAVPVPKAMACFPASSEAAVAKQLAHKIGAWHNFV